MKVLLSQLKPGDEGKIYAILTTEIYYYRKLLNLGFFPGNTVRVLQTFPSYLLQINYTQIALDREMSELIEVVVNPVRKRG